MKINALAAAGLDHLADGEWRLHSRFRQAINFVQPGGQLLTLYRYGKGLGPAGVLLSSRDFDRCLSFQRIEKQGGRLNTRRVSIESRRELCLKAGRRTLWCPNIDALPGMTGLCGPLCSLNLQLLDCRSLVSGLRGWYRGESIDWSVLIGKGPGLTPSGDDMLIGAMAVLASTGLLMPAKVATFLPPANQLASLTTSVSCRYLDSAREGVFSTPVLRVLYHMNPARNPYPAIQRLLSVGHTSGADILSGMIVALEWLRTLQDEKEYARSGNPSHIYTHC